LFKIAFVMAMLFTLSRTVWLGLILGIIFIAYSRGLKLSRIIVLFVILIFLGVALYFVLLLSGLGSNFLLDIKLGGRITYFDTLWTSGIIPYQQAADLYEIVYIGIIRNYGYIGLMLFLLFTTSPIFAMRTIGVRLNQQTAAAVCLQGIYIYLVLAMSDGAFNYIPVMQIFWMLAAMGISCAMLRPIVRDG
jgi:hypothetical protein